MKTQELELMVKLLSSFRETIQVCQTVSGNIHSGMPQEVLAEDQSSLYQQIAKAMAVIHETEVAITEQENSLLLGERSITLSQVAEQLQGADAIIIDDTVLYGDIDQDPPRLLFSWEDEGETVEVEIDKDNLVSIEAISPVEIKIAYNGDDYAFVSKLDKTEFKFS